MFYAIIVAMKTSTVIVHTFNVPDVEDPDLYAAEPILNWEKSAAGQWVMEHSVETPWWQRAPTFDYYHHYQICAKLGEADLIFYKLKFQ